MQDKSTSPCNHTAQNKKISQRKLAEHTGISLGSCNKALKSLIDLGYISSVQNSYLVSELGDLALVPYRVDNAVILAAGLSKRFAPISYERPKGLVRVRGEVLIERQIRQLKEAGINDITLVVGYKKELFLYLEQDFGVSIRVNPDYLVRNNHSSLMVVRDLLKNTYICSSDDYFCENPFEQFVWAPYYATSYVSGKTSEWCVTTGRTGIIHSVNIGGSDAWVMLGHVYFNKEFSRRFIKILEDEYELDETKPKLWENLYLDHIKELSLTARKYPSGYIQEFDSLDELKQFDPYFIENIDSKIIDNIATVLKCKKSQIHDIYPLSQGLTNLSCHFSVDDKEYVYRHPGAGTQKIIDRKSEVVALKMARDLALDMTFLYEDEAQGWKISHFIKNARALNPHDKNELKSAMEMAKKLHSAPIYLDRSFSFFEESLRYESLIENFNAHEVPNFIQLKKDIARLHEYVLKDQAPRCLCHNDFFHLNFLLDQKNTMSLIDWEYAGMGDYAQDFATFCVCCELSDQEIDLALEFYFGRKPSFEEKRHNLAFIALAAWCWYLWALYKESEAEDVGSWMYTYWRYAHTFLYRSLALYERN